MKKKIRTFIFKVGKKGKYFSTKVSRREDQVRLKKPY
jgi:hypothetical protein